MLNMTPMMKRWALFLFGCILVRLAFVYLAKFASPNILRLMGAIAILPAIGFLYLWFTNSRLTGMETGNGPIWWHSLRIVHGLLYALFAIMAINANPNAYVVLAFDVVFGLVIFFAHHIFGVIN